LISSPGEVVYVMQIAEVMPLGSYWRDPRSEASASGGRPLNDLVSAIDRAHHRRRCE
jgi:hypothetical protein